VVLPVLRQVAPRAFVNQLWREALQSGRRSRLICPACTQPFKELVGGGYAAQIAVCVRCYWVWLGAELVSSLSTATLPPPARRRAIGARTTKR
jgi:hypothetical protein